MAPVTLTLAKTNGSVTKNATRLTFAARRNGTCTKKTVFTEATEQLDINPALGPLMDHAILQRRKTGMSCRPEDFQLTLKPRAGRGSGMEREGGRTSHERPDGLDGAHLSYFWTEAPTGQVVRGPKVLGADSWAVLEPPLGLSAA